MIVLPKHFFKLPLYWESTSVHLVNFAIYVFGLCSLEFFVNGLIHRRDPSDFPDDLESLHAWAQRLIGYALFLYSSLSWLSADIVTPDLCVEGIFLLIAGVIIRIQSAGATWANSAILGLLLGVGYLTKVVLFPLALVFFLASAFAPGNPRKSIVRPR